MKVFVFLKLHNTKKKLYAIRDTTSKPIRQRKWIFGEQVKNIKKEQIRDQEMEEKINVKTDSVEVIKGGIWFRHLKTMVEGRIPAMQFGVECWE